MGRRRARTPGRPPAIADADAVTRMLDAVRAGVPITYACHYAGVSESAHKRAMAAGEDADDQEADRQAAQDAGEHPDTVAPPLTERQAAYRAYRAEFLRARAETAVAHVALVGKAARGGQVIREVERTEPDGTTVREVERARGEWKASAWLLAKSFPAELGERRAVEHSGPGGGPITHAGPAEDALSAIAERLGQVAERQAAELPGGWEPGGPRAIGPAVRADVAGDLVDDAVVVDDTGDGAR